MREDVPAGVHLHVCVYVRMRTCVCVQVCTHARMHVCTCVSMCVYACMHVGSSHFLA